MPTDVAALAPGLWERYRAVMARLTDRLDRITAELATRLDALLADAGR